MQLRCLVERITYRSEQSGYSIIKTRVKGFSDLVPVVGNLMDVNVGSVLLVTGDWKIDPKYGRQFVAASWEETLPATVYGIEKYLGSGLIKGVGPKYAKKIVTLFGDQTLEIIETDPNRLIEVPGIGNRRVTLIRDGWEKQKEIKNVMLFLQSHDVSTAHAARIYKAYGKDSIQTIQDNPYRLADDIWGIGFKTADSIAMKLGMEKEKYARCRSGLLYTLNKLSEEGHCFALREQLIHKGTELLEVDESLLSITLDEMIRVKDVIIDHELQVALESGRTAVTATADNKRQEIKQDSSLGVDHSEVPESSQLQPVNIDAIYLPPFYFSEVGVAKKLYALMKAELKTKISGPDRVIAAVEKQAGIQYDEVQLQAIHCAINSKVMVLTGGPGTGKTTTMNSIIKIYLASGYEIILAAPTGRAAKRMTETSGMEAKTIHRLLEYQPAEGYKINEDNPLQGDVLIVDECSMIDILLMYNLLKAVPENMTVILIGDTDQLPSIGAGNVLRDIISSDVIPVVKLERIFRQAQGSRIVMNAHRINRGEFPDISNRKDSSGQLSDFFFISDDEPEHALAQIVPLCQKRLPAAYHLNPINDIQVLTPMQRGVIGAVSINKELQNALNPGTVMLYHGGTEYRLHDKVMQLKNNYDKSVFNGDIGIVSAIDTEERELTVDFDIGHVVYDITELDELTLAYATTIHKAQGSEYPVVVMPILMTHFVMLQRNLIYTGITRAKKLLVLIGSWKALSYAIRNNNVLSRNTRLAERLRGIVLRRAY
ncbi:MAG: ATP-dependent RecD-like DNA helicase [Eubacteriales bacterium]|nr:ATP-dependent RecD-like DNA helicase [Eubacteriales bacterium]